jgi:hypothetical protein
MPDSTDVAIRTGTDQAVTPIALPKIGFAMTAVGIPITKNVALATTNAATHLLVGHNITAVKQVGVISVLVALQRMMIFRQKLMLPFSLKHNRNDCSLALRRTLCLGVGHSHCM